MELSNSGTVTTSVARAIGCQELLARDRVLRLRLDVRTSLLVIVIVVKLSSFCAHCQRCVAVVIPGTGLPPAVTLTY